MTWTVSRRIIIGYALALVLIAAVAAIGIWSLGRTAGAYSSAFEVERGVVLPARDAVAASRSANISFLRYLVEEEQVFASARDSAITAARTHLNTLSQRDATAAASWREAQQLLDQWAQQTTRALEAATASQTDIALAQRQSAQQTRERFESVMEGAIAELQVRTDMTLSIAETTKEASESAIYIALGLALVLMIVSAYLLNRAISRPLQDTSNVLATSAAEILATTTEQASGATESLAAVTQTAATVDEVVQTAEQATERARAVAASAQRAAEIGRQGRQAVEQSGAAMEQVRVQVNSIGNSILELAEQAQAIGEIITTVNDLAEQTNLLALNAAIEAARAGEQGRGFSVVAGEVRGLAEQSKNSTVRVRQILGEIQRATSAAVMATEQGNKQVEEGSRQVKEAGETIRQLADAIQAAAQAAAQISASANQQSTGMTQIKQAVGSIQQASQQNLAATRQAESAAQELNRMGSQLQALVGTEIKRPSAA